MFVLRQLGPEAAEDAVAGSGRVGRWRGGGGGGGGSGNRVKGAEDEFGRVELG